MRNIADGLDSLTFEVDLDDDEMVTDAIILARVTRMSDGRTSMVMTKSDHTDVVTTTGLLHCGLEIHSAADWCPVDDDED
jgi:hypothetical protein